MYKDSEQRKPDQINKAGLLSLAGNQAEVKIYKSDRKNSNSDHDLMKMKETQSVVNNMINDVLSDEEDGGTKKENTTCKQRNSENAFIPFGKYNKKFSLNKVKSQMNPKYYDVLAQNAGERVQFEFNQTKNEINDRNQQKLPSKDQNVTTHTDDFASFKGDPEISQISDSEIFHDASHQVQRTKSLQGSTYGTQNNNSTLKNGSNLNDDSVYYRNIEVSNQAKILMGFTNNFVNPNLTQLTEQSYYKKKEMDLQDSKTATSASNFQSKSNTNYWNQNQPKYQVRYTLDDFEVQRLQQQSPQEMQQMRQQQDINPTHHLQQNQQTQNYPEIQANMNCYQNQQFQNQNLMLNRDPDFLPMQQQIQRRLMDDYHKKINKKEFNENGRSENSALQESQDQQSYPTQFFQQMAKMFDSQLNQYSSAGPQQVNKMDEQIKEPEMIKPNENRSQDGQLKNEDRLDLKEKLKVLTPSNEDQDEQRDSGEVDLAFDDDSVEKSDEKKSRKTNSINFQEDFNNKANSKKYARNSFAEGADIRDKFFQQNSQDNLFFKDGDEALQFAATSNIHRHDSGFSIPQQLPIQRFKSNFKFNEQRFSNFSDDKMKRMAQAKSDHGNENRSSNQSGTNFCSSVDPNEAAIQEVEQQILGFINSGQESLQNSYSNNIRGVHHSQPQNGIPSNQYQVYGAQQQQLQFQSVNAQQQNMLPQYLMQNQQQQQFQQNPMMAFNNMNQAQNNLNNQSQPFMPNQSPQQYQQFSQEQLKQQMYLQNQANLIQSMQQQYSLNQQNQMQMQSQPNMASLKQGQNYFQNQQHGVMNYPGAVNSPQTLGSGTFVHPIQQIHQLLAISANDPRLHLSLTQGFELVCCTDQKCSRFIQERIMMLGRKQVDSELLDFFARILKNQNIKFDDLVYDSFGNYIIQKILQVPDLPQEYSDIIYERVKGKVFKYSTHKHGCRVMQTSFEILTFSQKEEMIKEFLDGKSVKDASFDFNGNHVIQKIISEMGQQTTSKSMIAFMNEINVSIIDFSVHEYCCRIVQRMFEKCHPAFVLTAAETIIKNYYYLSKNEYGIFVLSSMLENCQDEWKDQILLFVKGNAARMSLERDGSKLIENSIKMIQKIKTRHANQAQQLMSILDEIVNLPMKDPQGQYGYQQIFFSDLLTNQFSNYVIQRAFENSELQRREIMIQKMQMTLNTNPNVKETNFKHILKFIKRYDIQLRGNQIVFGPNSQMNQSNYMNQYVHNPQEEQYRQSQNLNQQFNRMSLSQNDNGNHNNYKC